MTRSIRQRQPCMPCRNLTLLVRGHVQQCPLHLVSWPRRYRRISLDIVIFHDVNMLISCPQDTISCPVTYDIDMSTSYIRYQYRYCTNRIRCRLLSHCIISDFKHAYDVGACILRHRNPCHRHRKLPRALCLCHRHLWFFYDVDDIDIDDFYMMSMTGTPMSSPMS